MRKKMILYNIKTFTTRIHVISVGLFLLALILIAAGCSPVSTVKKTSKKITNIFNFSDENLKQKVGLAFFKNKTLITGLNFEKIFPDNLAETIKEECHAILLVKPGATGRPDLLGELPRQASGRVDNLALAKAGRQLGYNAIVTGALIDIRTKNKERGFLWFKKGASFIQVTMLVEVYDTETGAKLLDESYMGEIKVDISEAAPLMAGYKIDRPAMKEALLQVAKSMGEKICASVSSQPWKGYIISIKGDKVAISSGSDAGLKVGQILGVYDSLKIIEGANSQRFFIPGLKTGEVKITAVYPDRAEAVAASDNAIRTGSTVKLQKKS